MTFQGIFNIFNSYLSGIELFYSSVDNHFLVKIRNHFNINEETDVDKVLSKIVIFLTNEFVKLGLKRAKVKNRFSDKFLSLKLGNTDVIASIANLYEKKLAPIIYEIIMENIVFYLVDSRGEELILSFRNHGIFSVEFMLELRNLKSLFQNSPEKLENLRKYIRIRDKIIIKFCSNKNQIQGFENLEDFDSSHEKLQLLYLIYRIIDFFNIQNLFDFSHIKSFLKNHFDDCLVNLPFISLKNPDLCYCALYLGKKLNVDINEGKVKEFLEDLFEEYLDGFTIPIIEANGQLYFYFKSTSLVKLYLKNDKIKELIKMEPEFFTPKYLENLETSQLAVIIKILAFLEYFDKIDKNKINIIYEEINKRITPAGIKQSRDGLVTSEATYYVMFSNYISHHLDVFKNENLLDSLVSRIYRNLEFLEFSSDMNLDLLSELVYSLESLRLFNCINSDEMILSLAKFLFPEEVVNKLKSIKGTSIPSRRSKHMMVNRSTGETVYTL